jgi:hypothetical protein
MSARKAQTIPRSIQIRFLATLERPLSDTVAADFRCARL